jgi:putative transposase
LDEKGKLLGDVRFVRDRMGRWGAVAQRMEVAPKPRRPAELRTSVFLDPGTRAGNAYYSPDTAETGAYMEGEGGIDRLFSLAIKVDTLASSCRPGGERVPGAGRWGGRPARTVPAEGAHREYVHDAKKREHRLRAKIRDLVDDAHKRMAKDLTSRFDTIVIPKFETQRMAKRPRAPTDRARVIRNKTARQLYTLSHYRFRGYLEHRCAVDGSAFALVTEEYTTKACPYCGVCYDVGASKTFGCICGFTADRDEKAAFALCVKYAR